MKLFYVPASPFARKVHATIIELGMFDCVELLPTPVLPGQPNVDYAKAHNPLGKIPALQLDSGDTLFDSSVICEYLDSISPSIKLLPPEGVSRFRTLTRHALAHGICESAVAIRYETFLRPEPQQWKVWIEDQWNKIDRALIWFDTQQSEWRNEFDLAQLTLACALGYLDFRTPEKTWRSTHPSLASWFDEVSQRESLQATIPTA